MDACIEQMLVLQAQLHAQLLMAINHCPLPCCGIIDSKSTVPHLPMAAIPLIRGGSALMPLWTVQDLIQQKAAAQLATASNADCLTSSKSRCA
jgi:hypothetical protein